MAYIGKSIESGTFALLDTSGNTYNGSNTTFSLGTQVGSPAQLLVSHDGVLQKPGTDYILASGGTQITFTTAPASGASIFIVEISGAVGGPLDSDLNGNELILDADGDTSITADTDDQIDVKISGADDFKFTANNFNVLSGSTLTIDSGATITNSGTANGFGVAADDISAGDGAINLTTTSGNITIDAQAGDSDIIFKGTDGSSDITALTIDMSDAGILNVKSGIKFPATQVASSDDNTLDDYEVGTFTPVLGGAGGTSGQTYGLQGGNYVKIGDRVFIDANTSLQVKGTITGNLQVQGLPFTSKNNSAYRASASHSYIHSWSASTNETMINSLIYENSAVISIGESEVDGNEAWQALTTSQVNDASEINTSINYRVA
jgi:hypothetical protein